jgi:hypothetical protein
MNDEKLISRIKKILARAASANVHEAETAAAMAHEMMLANKLTEADVAGFESEIGDHELPGNSFYEAWRFALATAVAESCFCRVLRIIESGGLAPTVHIIGLKQDFETVKSLFEFLVGEIDRLCDLGMPRGTVDARDSFRRGAVIAVQYRLLRQVHRFERSSEKALVIVRDNAKSVGDFIDKNYGTREPAEDLGDAADRRAQLAGYTAGQNIPIPGRDDGENHGVEDDLDDPIPTADPATCEFCATSQSDYEYELQRATHWREETMLLREELRDALMELDRWKKRIKTQSEEIQRLRAGSSPPQGEKQEKDSLA